MDYASAQALLPLVQQIVGVGTATQQLQRGISSGSNLVSLNIFGISTVDLTSANLTSAQTNDILGLISDYMTKTALPATSSSADDTVQEIAKTGTVAIAQAAQAEQIVGP